MLNPGRFIGLPEEFSPPDRAAERIADLPTLAEREAFWLRIPEGWRPMIGHFAVRAIACRIEEMPEKHRRQDALASVPEMWREEVKAFVLTLWKTREIRAQHRAELAERDARRKEAVRA
jgi:hypothetical protein